MSLPRFDITCVSRTSYGYEKRSSTYRLPALKGRPRYRLRDTWASYVVNLQWEFTGDQWLQFQQFWSDSINAGADPFEMRLQLDSAFASHTGEEIYQVHATEGFQATIDAHQIWTVRLQVEVAGGFRIGLVICPVIYGGPITNLAGNDYYGGPITDLAMDIIEPCPGIVGDANA